MFLSVALFPSMEAPFRPSGLYGLYDTDDDDDYDNDDD